MCIKFSFFKAILHESRTSSIIRAKLADKAARWDKAAEFADKESSLAHREAELTDAVDCETSEFCTLFPT